MTADEAKAILRDAAGSEEPSALPPSALKDISLSDVPNGIAIRIGTLKRDNVLYLDWEGSIGKESGRFVGRPEYSWSRKYWYGAIGLEQYLDLVRRAVEVRNRVQRDVSLPLYDDDGALIRLTFDVQTDERNLNEAYRHIRAVCEQLEEAADGASDVIGKRIAEVAARLSGWGSESLDSLVNAVENAKTPDDRGRSLEELSSRLLETVPGFTVTDRIKTATEEIDISILNGSDDPRFRREGAVILAECKNWSSKCGKNEVVVFRSKLKNRFKRCTSGLLVSWNGFAATVTKELLRGSKGKLLVVAISGKDIRAAVREQNFRAVLAKRWDEAIHT